MKYKVRIHDRQNHQFYDVEVRGDRYILDELEDQGIKMPCACINGACTTCAMRVKSGKIDQSEVIGLSTRLQQEGYALICAGYALSDLELETQDEDEVYQLQFGQYFKQQSQKKPWFRFNLPIDHD